MGADDLIPVGRASLMDSLAAQRKGLWSSNLLGLGIGVDVVMLLFC